MASFIGVVNSTSGEMRVVVNDGSQPSWSPDGNKIAYSGGGIMVVNVDGTNATRISDDGLWGGSGDDLMVGSGGQDMLNGNSGNDRMWGNAEEDRLYDLNSDDRHNGGAGKDMYDDASENNLFFNCEEFP
jgi:Ca2+-binding RTX toxin-like protein